MVIFVFWGYCRERGFGNKNTLIFTVQPDTLIKNSESNIGTDDKTGLDFRTVINTLEIIYFILLVINWSNRTNGRM